MLFVAEKPLPHPANFPLEVLRKLLFSPCCSKCYALLPLVFLAGCSRRALLALGFRPELAQGWRDSPCRTPGIIREWQHPPQELSPSHCLENTLSSWISVGKNAWNCLCTDLFLWEGKHSPCFSQVQICSSGCQVISVLFFLQYIKLNSQFYSIPPPHSHVPHSFSFLQTVH